MLSSESTDDWLMVVDDADTEVKNTAAVILHRTFR